MPRDRNVSQKRRTRKKSDNRWGDSASMGVIFLLIATLPLSTFKFSELELSVTNLSILLVILLGSVFILSGRIALFKPTMFDMLHILFLFAACVSVLMLQYPESESVLAKTTLMVAFYFFLKILFSRFSERALYELVVVSARCGVLLYAIMFLVALAQPGVLSSVISGGADFYGFTLNIYRGAFSLLGFDSNIRGVDIRRNTVGVVFAFYFGIFLLASSVWKVKGWFSGRLSDVVFASASMVFILMLFSRRAALICILIYLILSVYTNASRVKMYVFGCIGLVVTVWMFFRFQVENRFTNVSDDSRFWQFRDAWDIFLEHPFTGLGYGARLLVGDTVYAERYVHNFHLANAYMLGVFGLVISLTITWILLKKLVGIVSNPDKLIAVLLVVVLFDMLVSSAVEGMYVPVSWVVLALCMRKEPSIQRRRFS